MEQVPLVRTSPAPGGRHVPVRTCVGCREPRPQSQLVRLARCRDGVRHDLRKRLGGRGAYLCRDLRCIEAAAQRDAAPLRRALRGAAGDEVQAALAYVRAEVVQQHEAHGNRLGAGPDGPEKKVRHAP